MTFAKSHGFRSSIDALEVVDSAIKSASGRRDGRRFSIEGDLFVIACGAYGTPLLLQRSGVGDPSVLEAAELSACIESVGVGRNLQDHPCINLRFAGTATLVSEMRAHEAECGVCEEGVLIKKRSRLSEDAFDLHVFSCGGRPCEDATRWDWRLFVGLMCERSRGTVLLDRAIAGAEFTIDHNHFSDPGAEDMKAIVDGLRLARHLAQQSPLRERAGIEIAPGPARLDDADLEQWVLDNHTHYWHPGGSCRMGTDRRRGDVCDGHGAIFGITNGFIADASLMPTLPRANTNLPVALLGWRVGRHVANVAT